MANLETIGRRHVLVVPHQGLGHVNPMFNLSKMIAARRPNDVHISFFVSDEWAGLLQSESKSDEQNNNNNTNNNIIIISLPNFMPPAQEARLDPYGCLKKAVTEMKEKVKEFLDSLQDPPHLLIADTLMTSVVQLGEKRKIPVASFWPGSASLFTAFYHHQLIVNSKHYPIALSGGAGEERIDFIPGISSIRLVDLPYEFHNNDKQGLDMLTTMVGQSLKAKCIIFRTTKELDEPSLASLRSEIFVPLYPIGPAIPYVRTPPKHDETPDYIKWLDKQQQNSVLYISQGSFLSSSDAQIDELVFGLKDSKIPFLWVARDQAEQLSSILGDQGTAVKWCDQMRVLSHPSIGGFLTHCGWNSIVEAAFAGVPILTFPLAIDQMLNSKIIVEDWEVGLRVKDNFEDFVTREKISMIFKKVMDSKGSERQKLTSKSNKFKESLLLGVREDGSTSNFDDFLAKFFPEVLN